MSPATVRVEQRRARVRRRLLLADRRLQRRYAEDDSDQPTTE